MFFRYYSLAISLIISIPAYANCNITDNRGANCVNMTGVTRERSGNVTVYRMKFQYNGGLGCPEAIPVEGITGRSDEPGTFVSRRNPISTITCTDTLGCSGFSGWICKGGRGKRAAREYEAVQSPPPAPADKRNQEKQPSALKISECNVIDAYCSKECSDYYKIGSSINNSPRTNDLIAQCIGTTCEHFNKSCLQGKKTNKQDVINLFKRMPNNPKYQQEAAPTPKMKSTNRQASTRQSCRENYEKWIEVDPTNAKMQAAGAESYADCLAGRNPDRALDAWLNDPAKFEGSEVASNSSPVNTMMPLLGSIAAARANSNNRRGYAPPSTGVTVSGPTPSRAAPPTRHTNEAVRGGP